jgi:dTDP-4-dehydrorhamnose 3,5-epimerase
LVRVVSGVVLDVAVDLRRHSPRFGQSVTIELDAVRHQQLWIPPGFAHGFLVLSDRADFLYKTTDYWYPEHERSLLWNDPDLAIPWPAGLEPQLAAKDAAAKRLAEAEVFD